MMTEVLRGQLDLHPICAALPEMEAADFAQLVKDIQQNGLQEPIMLFKGRILDGRHRWRACLEAGIEPDFEEFSGTDDDAVAWVIAKNIHRRHLTPQQRAAALLLLLSHSKQTEQPASSGAKRAVAGTTVSERAATAGVARATQARVEQAERAMPGAAAAIAKGEMSIGDVFRKLRAEPEETTEKTHSATPETEQTVSHETVPTGTNRLTNVVGKSIEQLQAERIQELEAQVVALQAAIEGSAGEEIAKAQAQLVAYSRRINGLLQERNELSRQASYWQKQAAKWQKQAVELAKAVQSAKGEVADDEY